MKLEYNKNVPFVWVNPEVRFTAEETKAYLTKHPSQVIDIGDGKGSVSIKGNIKVRAVTKKPARTKQILKKRISKGQNLIQSAGMSWEEKHELVLQKIKEKYGEVPVGVSFVKLNLRSGSNEQNPDGLRLLVKVEGLPRQRLYDYKGVIKLHKIFKELDKLTGEN